MLAQKRLGRGVELCEVERSVARRCATVRDDRGRPLDQTHRRPRLGSAFPLAPTTFFAWAFRM